MHTSRLLDARLHVTTGQPGAADGGLALYQLALAAVECALDAWLAPAVDAWAVGGDDDVVPDAPLRDAPVRAALACACDAARAHDVSIVRLLLVITYAWSRALRSRRRPGNPAPHLLAHLFALGIREYIAPAIPAPRRPRRACVVRAVGARRSGHGVGRTDGTHGPHVRTARTNRMYGTTSRTRPSPAGTPSAPYQGRMRTRDPYCPCRRPGVRRPRTSTPRNARATSVRIHA